MPQNEREMKYLTFFWPLYTCLPEIWFIEFRLICCPVYNLHSEPKQAFFLHFLGFLVIIWFFLWLQGAFIFASGNWHWHWHFCIIIIVSLLYSQGIEHLIFSLIMSMSYLSILTNKKGKARLATSSVVSIEDIRKEWRRSAVEEVVLIRLSFSTTLCELTKNENYKKI